MEKKWFVFLTGFAICLINGWAFAQTAYEKIPQSILAEVKSAEMLPNGRYTEVKEWGVDNFFHGIGSTAVDPDARGGKAWDVSPYRDKGTGFMNYGPYDQLDPGNYIAFFRMKMLEDPGDDIIATAEVVESKGVTKLAARSIPAADLIPGKYVQIPIAFHFAGKDLECRVSWTGSTALRMDKVTIYRFDGDDFPDTLIPMVPQPVSTGTIKNLEYNTKPHPYKDLFPRSSKPASKLLVCDLTNAAPDLILAVTTLQGIVNREVPRVYCLIVPADALWLEWIKKRNWITETESITPLEMISRFSDKLKGIVITDPYLPSSKNIATMIAGVENALAVSPRLAKQLKLPVVADLRGRWTKNTDAYRWAYKTLWSKMNHHTAACMWPDLVYTRDYLVQHKIFVFWLPGRIDGAEPYADAKTELKFGEELLAALPINSPIMGFSWHGDNIGIGELPGVGLMAEFGKFLVGSVDAPNMSVHSGFEVTFPKQKKLPFSKAEGDKIYIAYTMSDGDNIPVLTATNWPQLWHQPERGQFPIGWGISPSSCMLIPDIMDFYHTTATQNDSFLAAVSGVGYTYPRDYGKRYKAADRERIFDGFLSLTDQYMKRMNLSIVCPTGADLPQFSRYAERIPALDAIFADYGKTVFNYLDATRITARNVPVFRAVTPWNPIGDGEQQIESMVERIKAMTPKKTRPAFMHVFIGNWYWDLAGLKEVLKRLGSEYVIVSPDQLSAMYRKWISEQQVSTNLPISSASIEGYRFDVNYTIQNVTPKPMKADFTVKGLEGVGIIPSTAMLEPGKEAKIALSGKAVADKITVEARGSFGLRQTMMNVKRIPYREILGTLPKNTNLQFVSDFRIDPLIHTTGKPVIDVDGSVCLGAEKGSAQPGFLAYGPYAGLDAGRYLAIFRIKRTGEGSGNIAMVDTCVAGQSTSTASRLLTADELPVGAYRSVALMFDHPGGAYESRVLWTGNASLVFDHIIIWKIMKSP